MPKFSADFILDASLDEIRTQTDRIAVCEGEPTTYAEASNLKGSGGKALGHKAKDLSWYTIQDGSPDGRELLISGITTVSIDVNGTFDHYAFIDDAGSRLIYVDESLTTTQQVTSGGTVDLTQFTVTVRDPV